MNWNRFIKKSIQLMTTSCLVCVVKNSGEATEFLLPLDAFFQDGGISINANYVLNLVEEVNNNPSNPDHIGILIDTVDSENNLSPRVTTQINRIVPSSSAISTAISTIYTLMGHPTSNPTDPISTRIGTPAQTSLTTTIGGMSGSSLSIRLGDPGVGHTLADNIADGASSIQDATSTVQVKLATLSNPSLTPNRDLYRLLIDGNSGSTSGLLPKITGNSSNTLLDGIESLAANLDGSTSGSITGSVSSNLLAKLATQITSIKGSGTQLSTVVSDINAQLGAAGTTSARVSVIDNSILTSPSGVVTTDMSSLSALMVSSPAATLQEDAEALNTLINGTATGSTTQARITSATTSIESSATQLTTAISDVNTLLGGSGTTMNRVNSADSILDGVQSMSGLTSFTVSTPASNSAGTVSMIGNDGTAGRTYSLVFASSIANGSPFTLTHSGSGNTITFVNNSGGSLASAAALATYLASAYPVNAVLKNTTNAKATALETVIGGAGYSAMSNAIALDDALLESPTGVLTTDRSTVAGELVNSPSTILETDIHTLNNLLDGTPTGSTTQARIASVMGTIETGATQLTTAISDANTTLGGSGTTMDRINSVDALLDGVQSMNGLSSFRVMTTASNPGGNTVNIVGDDGVSNNITYSTTFSSSIASLGTFTMNTGPKTITFINNSGGSIASAAALATYLASAYPVNAVLEANTTSKVTELSTFLGGSGYTVMTKAVTIDDALLGNPTSNITTDLATLRGEIVTSLGANAEADIQTLNTLINGTATGSTTQARITSATTSIEASATRLTTAISDLNSVLGGSGTTITRVNSVNASLDGVQSMSGLSSFTVSTPASNSAGTVTIIGNDGTAGRSYSLVFASSIANGSTFTLTDSGSGNTITFVNNSGGSLASAAALATYLADAYPINALLKANANTKATALESFLGGAGYSAMSNAATIDASLLTNPTSNISTDISTLNSLVDGNATGSTLQDRLGAPTLGGSSSNLAAVLGGTSTTIADRLGDPGSSKTIIGNIGGSTTSVQAALNDLATTLVSNTNFSSSLYANLTTQSTSLDSGLSSLPSSSTYATIGTAAASDGSSGVDIVINGGLGGANGTYNLPAATITNSIGSGGTFTLTNGSDNLVLVNRSGGSISTQAQAISYLASMYPVASKIATGMSDKITNGLNTMLGGSASSVRAKIASIDAGLLNTPTGVVSTDFATLNAKIVTIPGSTAEDNVSTINALLDGTSTGSTIQARIGSPTVNGSGSNLFSVVGGSASSLADRLGDPVTGTVGLASVIRNNGASLGTVNGFDCSSFDNATAIYDQINAFLSILSQNVGSSQIIIPNGTYTNLRSVLAALNHD